MFGEGFGGQILGSAIGQQLEDAITKTIEFDTALDLLDVDKLRDSIVRITGELEYQIDVLKRAGKADEARALAAAEVYRVTGLSAETIDNVANKTRRLQQSWEGLVGSGRGLITAIAGLGSLIPGLTAILDLTATIVRGWTQLLSLTLDVGTGLRAWFQNLVFGEGTAQKVKEKFGGINEETEKIKAQLKGAVDQQLLSAQLGKRLLDIERQRTIDASIQGKLKDIDLNKQAKIVQIESTAATKKAEALLKYGGLKDAASQKELATLLKLIAAEANQGKETAGLVAARERLVAINANLVEQDKVRIALLQMQGEIEQAREAATSQVLATQIQELEQRKQIAATLTGELTAVNAIYAKKKEGADAAYATAQREAALKVQIAAQELASAEAQRARGAISDEQLAQARNVYNTAVAVTQENLRGAAAIQQGAVAAADLEKRQQAVAAYTAQYASEAGRATNKLNEAAAAVQNQASYSQALYQAQTTLNNIQIQSLQTALATTTNIGTRVEIIRKIKDLEIENARIAYNSTVSQIKVQVESLRIAYQQAEVKYKELQAVVAIARAQGLINRSYLDALAAQESALKIAAGNLETGQKTAEVNIKAAGAVYNAAVSAAKLRAETSSAATAAGSFAGSMQNAAGAARSAADAVASMDASRNRNTLGVTLEGFSSLEPWMERQIAAQKQAAIAGAGRDPIRAYTAGVTAEIQARSEFQRVIDAKQKAQDEQAKTEYYGQTMQSSPNLSMERLKVLMAETAARAAAASGPTTVSPQINVTTGPVIQQDNQNYVSFADLERAMQITAQGVISGVSTPAGRYATGIR